MFTPVSHQFTLFEYNDMRPKWRIPIKRISRERMEEAMKLMKSGRSGKMLDMLRDLNDQLEKYEQRITNKPNHHV